MMKTEVGDREFDIWLLGDSDPKNWRNVLDTPLDPRHPARHNIWTSLADVTQDRVFRECRCRIDTSRIYIRNVIQDPGEKPANNSMQWAPKVEEKVLELQALVERYRPTFLLAFGAFAYEFARRALGQQPKYKYAYWSAKSLGAEFVKMIESVNMDATNVIPLLHNVISRRTFLQAHNNFSQQVGANYFDLAGNAIAEVLIRHRDELQIWIE